MPTSHKSSPRRTALQRKLSRFEGQISLVKVSFVRLFKIVSKHKETKNQSVLSLLRKADIKGEAGLKIGEPNFLVPTNGGFGRTKKSLGGRKPTSVNNLPNEVLEMYEEGSNSHERVSRVDTVLSFKPFAFHFKEAQQLKPADSLLGIFFSTRKEGLLP